MSKAAGKRPKILPKETIEGKKQAHSNAGERNEEEGPARGTKRNCPGNLRRESYGNSDFHTAENKKIRVEDLTLPGPTLPPKRSRGKKDREGES